MSLRGLKFASCVLGYLLFLVSCTSVNQPKKEMLDLVMIDWQRLQSKLKLWRFH